MSQQNGVAGARRPNDPVNYMPGWMLPPGGFVKPPDWLRDAFGIGGTGGGFGGGGGWHFSFGGGGNPGSLNEYLQWLQQTGANENPQLASWVTEQPREGQFTEAARRTFEESALPMIQQQMALAGLSRSTAPAALISREYAPVNLQAMQFEQELRQQAAQRALQQWMGQMQDVAARRSAATGAWGNLVGARTSQAVAGIGAGTQLGAAQIAAETARRNGLLDLWQSMLNYDMARRGLGYQGWSTATSAQQHALDRAINSQLTLADLMRGLAQDRFNMRRMALADLMTYGTLFRDIGQEQYDSQYDDFLRRQQLAYSMLMGPFGQAGVLAGSTTRSNTSGGGLFGK